VQSLQKSKDFLPRKWNCHEKSFSFPWSSAFVGDKFFLVPARPGYVDTTFNLIRNRAPLWGNAFCMEPLD
jgi:hypothetical protein